MVDFEIKPHLDVFKAWMVKGASFSDVNQLPLLRGSDFKPRRAIPFENAIRARDLGQWVHFYIDDRRFERLWNNPKRYLEILRRFEGVITPDYSLYRDMPLVMQKWNIYRNRAIGYWLQSNGIDIVPNVRWSDDRSYSFAFEGLEQGGTVAVSTNGTIQDKLDRHYFKKGLEEMVRRLVPDTIVVYSQAPDDVFGKYRDLGIEIIHIENYHQRIRKKPAIAMDLEFFGSGGGGGFRSRGRGRRGRNFDNESGRTYNSREQGRRQRGDMPMRNDDQNDQIRGAARSLGVRLTPDQRERVHRSISGTGAEFDDVINAIKEVLNID